MTYYIRETIGQSNRKHMYSVRYDSLRSAYMHMRAKSILTYLQLGHTSVTTTDNTTHITVTSGRRVRVFNIVESRNGQPLDFSSLDVARIPIYAREGCRE